MNVYEPGNIRNIALVGHGGAGKTTLGEALLFSTGAINRMGKIEDGNTVSDHDPEEVRRGISVSLSLLPFEWGGVKVNVLDTPGYADFIGDVKGALRGAGAGLFVVSAVDGVQVQTEVIWEYAAEAGLPRAIVVNKLDRERASFQRTLDQLVKAFGTQVAPIQLPIGEEHEFAGVMDLLNRRPYPYPSAAKGEGGGTEGGLIQPPSGEEPGCAGVMDLWNRRAYRSPSAAKGEEGDWPEDLTAKAEPYRERLPQTVARGADG